jgi:hypothetical protein
MTLLFVFDSARDERIFARGDDPQARKISQPQSCCIYTSIEVFEDIPCLLLLAAKGRPFPRVFVSF